MRVAQCLPGADDLMEVGFHWLESDQPDPVSCEQLTSRLTSMYRYLRGFSTSTGTIRDQTHISLYPNHTLSRSIRLRLISSAPIKTHRDPDSPGEILVVAEMAQQRDLPQSPPSEYDLVEHSCDALDSHRFSAQCVLDRNHQAVRALAEGSDELPPRW